MRPSSVSECRRPKRSRSKVTDARDAYVVADAARTLFHLLHGIEPAERMSNWPWSWARTTDLAQGATRSPTGRADC
ncbi:hypothetical protein [Streptomyces pseudovenezuelae]|uniref:hypothetical protein n=1 Tax=Streptomyces pseudovenezuelae TaxID=67350 RepID=UPI0024738506|nr:hypothetical protein [Streptomyces pseudovenezuelae]